MIKRKLKDNEFRLMQGFMKLADHVYPHVQARSEAFGMEPGQTVVDYGCGPGRYTVEMARIVGAGGKVVAVDLVEMALEETQRKLDAGGFHNCELKLAHGYDSGIEDNTADVVFAIDMFHHISDANAFLREVYRIAKPDGLLTLSGGHMTRKTVKAKIAASGIWDIAEERREYIAYKKREGLG
ncbi:MAG: class I SAM-dependent methyltransferase [Clostridiales bacterium]|nr:class I SAM-dependent methyltransferase [Clostridiales bacterium]